ncbi:MAG: ErfK/YbiS/YcfS/YnhG family protein [Firmicutes bacterium]|nr:ErfK/YbiS/YcfS/YnhG family protein [Bacillota bacterium]
MYFVRVVAAIIGILVFGTVRWSYADPVIVAPVSIIVNIPSRTLEYYSGSDLVKVYPIAIGKPSTPTPLGQFFIEEKEEDPCWYPPGTGKVVASGPYNPLGYRWMGFYCNYGIHGTNAPASIGNMVSNGCIRMHEEDVEELYPRVPYHTKVTVVYERIKVRLDSNNRVSLTVYPDVYDYHALSLNEVRSILDGYGVNGWIGEDELSRLINEEAGQPLVIAKTQTIKVDEKKLDAYAVVDDNKLYVPVWPVAVALGYDLNWNEKTKQVKVRSVTALGMVKGDRIYINANDITKLFEVHTTWNQTENVLLIN